jgi:hypothetical protein
MLLNGLLLISFEVIFISYLALSRISFRGMLHKEVKENICHSGAQTSRSEGRGEILRGIARGVISLSRRVRSLGSTKTRGRGREIGLESSAVRAWDSKRKEREIRERGRGDGCSPEPLDGSPPLSSIRCDSSL